MTIHVFGAPGAGADDAEQSRLDKLREALGHLHAARVALEAAGGRRGAEEIRRAIERAEDEFVGVHRPRARFLRLRR